jgi:hypothetical protein
MPEVSLTLDRGVVILLLHAVLLDRFPDAGAIAARYFADGIIATWALCGAGFPVSLLRRGPKNSLPFPILRPGLIKGRVFHGLAGPTVAERKPPTRHCRQRKLASARCYHRPLPASILLPDYDVRQSASTWASSCRPGYTLVRPAQSARRFRAAARGASDGIRSARACSHHILDTSEQPRRRFSEIIRLTDSDEQHSRRSWHRRRHPGDLLPRSNC